MTTVKFPIWMIILLALQLLLALAFSAVGWVFSHAFSGTSVLNAAQTALLWMPPVAVMLCAWLSRRAWKIDKQTKAVWLVFMPVLIWASLTGLAQIVPS